MKSKFSFFFKDFCGKYFPSLFTTFTTVYSVCFFDKFPASQYQNPKQNSENCLEHFRNLRNKFISQKFKQNWGICLHNSSKEIK